MSELAWKSYREKKIGARLYKKGVPVGFVVRRRRGGRWHAGVCAGVPGFPAGAALGEFAKRWRAKVAVEAAIKGERIALTTDAQDAARVLRSLFRRLTRLFLLGDANPEWWGRAGGDVICEVCGQPYRMHAQHPHREWLNVLCDGRNVKL